MQFPVHQSKQFDKVCNYMILEYWERQVEHQLARELHVGKKIHSTVQFGGMDWFCVHFSYSHDRAIHSDDKTYIDSTQQKLHKPSTLHERVEHIGKAKLQ